jgi:two-component system response regulator
MTKTPAVLLVEDNNSDEVLALRALDTGSILKQTFVVRDGQQALDYLFCEGDFSKREASNPKIILLDIKLPKIDGIEVLRRLRANEATKHIPVVILTSSKEEKDMAAGFGSGANRYLIKPIKMEELNEALGQFLFSYSGMLKGLE